MRRRETISELRGNLSAVIASEAKQSSFATSRSED
jgi:hypothetical protein